MRVFVIVSLLAGSFIAILGLVFVSVDRARLAERKHRLAEMQTALARQERERAERGELFWRRMEEEQAELWREALEDVRDDPRFKGVELEANPGLYPRGKCPETGLWRFVLPGDVDVSEPNLVFWLTPNGALDESANAPPAFVAEIPRRAK